MTDYSLTLARPADPAECLAAPLLPLLQPPLLAPLQPPLWVAYLMFGGMYLADVNNAPALDTAYESGLDLWTACLPALIAALAHWWATP